ncbi:MAG: MFS transporter [Clostridiales bacterium]|nr:MFS transporter [Clostridiales bacterium]
MKFLKNHFSMYAHLPKEVYVLAFGKIMTSMGALIWPMLTLIMSEKLNLNGQTIGMYMMMFSMFMGPFYLLGGKLADKYNKKHIIVTFDLIGNSLYFVCAVLPISITTLYLLAVASVFQSMEQPAYDALIADLTTYKDRERAYSLNYLAMNLGLVMAPMIGGILFNNYLNLSFFINGLADISSTLLLFIFIKNVKNTVRDSKIVNEYEKGEAGSIFKVFSERKLFFLLFIISGIAAMIYNQFNFLMPLHMEEAFRGSGAFKFGILASINAVVVVIGTPIVTKKFSGVTDVRIMYLGQLLESVGLAFFIFVNRYFVVAVVGIIIFTTGEIFGSISKTPYLTKRIPETHRGRVLSITNSCAGLIGILSNYVIGILIDYYTFHTVWVIIAAIGLLVMILYSIYLRLDKKAYPGLYLE